MSLIKEFAIEPEVMAKWQHFRELWEDFGVAQGRLISVFPILWKSKVDELARILSKPVRATAISAKIRRDGHKFLVTGRNYSGAEDWLFNALSHMATQPFHAVIASENPKGVKEVLVAGEFAKDEAPYKVVVENFVPRTAQDLAACAGLLLQHCAEIQFIDPHFDPSEPRFSNTFEAMLRRCNTGSLKILEIHREKPATFIPGVQQAKYRRQLELLVPAKVTLKVYFWSQIPGGLELHPRFLLTDLGGMHFENGLDEGDPGKETLVKPLTHEVWQKCRAFYCEKSNAFALARDCIISVIGRG